MKLIIILMSMQSSPQLFILLFRTIGRQNHFQIKIITNICKFALSLLLITGSKMLNDKIFRQFKSQPFQQSYNGSHQFQEFRETLMIDEIIKCGKQILGSIGMTIDNQNEQTAEEEQNNGSSIRKSNQRRRKQKSKYIYEYDYGKNPKDSRKLLHKESDQPADEISFTLSNQDNKSEHLQHEMYQENHKNQRHIKWKANLLQQVIGSKKKQSMKQSINQKFSQFTKPIQNFQRASQQKSLKFQRFSEKTSIKNQYELRNPSFQNRIGNQVEKQTSFKKLQFKTPQKMTKASKKTLKMPLSQQITKNVYGKLKTEVQDKNFLQDYEQRQKISQEENEQRWKSFILRSEKWTDDRKNHLIQMQMTQKYSSPQKSRSKSKNNRQSQYSSYLSVKVKQKPIQHFSNFYSVVNDVKFPENTFKKTQNSPEKRQSSVQNCINKLKTQTQLLKVKLLSPLKQKMNDNSEIQHYKELNQSESRKSIKKYRQNYEEKPFAKTASTLIHVQNLYGKCIGQKPSN